MDIILQYLQKYIKAKDFSPDLKEQYFLKLSEEVGELVRAMRENQQKLELAILGSHYAKSIFHKIGEDNEKYDKNGYYSCQRN